MAGWRWGVEVLMLGMKIVVMLGMIQFHQLPSGDWS